MRRELRILIEALREGRKVTERKKAVDEITRWFGSSSNVKKVGGNNDEWIEVFDALAIAAKDEHDLAAKKTSKATDGKLEGISGAFRVVVEASIPYLNNASIEFLIPRLVAILKFYGALVGATGSNYARALLSLTSHPPHLRSLSDKYWYYISRTSWAILLGDKMQGRLGWEEEDPKLQPRSKKPDSTGQGASASPVQLIFATIIRHLCSSPFAPLIERHRRPLDQEEKDEDERDDVKPAAQANWAYFLLVKFCRYFEMYTGAVTSHVDMIPALCHVLSVVELNRIDDMMWFSRRIWSRLVALMKGRVRADYVHLIIVFKILVPYYIRMVKDDGKIENPVELIDTSSFHGLSDLVQVIDQSAPLKAGIECLSLESLRLEFTPGDVDAFTGFRAKAFRHGSSFTPSQAHSWATLELQADCIYSLFRQEELSSQPHTTHDGPPTKRRRTENAVEVLLREIQENVSQNHRLFRLQTLLMFIERYWVKIDSTHQQAITAFLVRNLGTDDLNDQFILLCFATFAASPDKPTNNSTTTIFPWATLWVQGYRLLVSQSPQVSRTASHLLCALLKWDRIESAIVHQHISQFSRDFRDDEDTLSYETLDDVEKLRSEASFGRQTIKFSTITESLCALLSGFISIADADASLCRLQLEDSVRKWLRQSLSHILTAERSRRATIRTGKGNNDVEKLRRASLRPDSHVNAQDILSLLQAISGLTTRPTLRCDIALPHDDFVRTIVVYQADRALRQFILEAKVPPFIHSSEKLPEDSYARLDNGTQQELITSPISSIPLAGEYAPSARESKTVLLLEDALRRLRQPAVSSPLDGGDQTTASDTTRTSNVAGVEKASVAIKVVSATLGLQGSLEMNGTRPNTELYRLAFETLQNVVPWTEVIADQQGWLASHWPDIVGDLRPLAWMGSSIIDPAQRLIEQFLLRPGEGSGIKRELARKLSVDPVESRRRNENDASLRLLTILWRQRPASDLLEAINKAFQVLLHAYADANSQEGASDAGYDNAKLFNAPSNADGMSLTHQGSTVQDVDEGGFISISVALISTTSMISKTGGNSGNDSWVDQLVLEAEGPAFLAFGKAWCESVRAGTLYASPTTVKKFLDAINQKLKIWDLWRSEVMHTLIFQFLDLLAPVWLKEGGEMRRTAEKLFPRWAERKAMDGGGWTSRVHFASFLASYLLQDPSQRWWRESEAEQSMDIDGQSVSHDEEGSPRDLFGDLMVDGDIRVRLMASILYPMTFQDAGRLTLDVMAIYNTSMTPKLPSDPSWFEGMLTRFVILANTMVVSSPLRRGVYWHLIEVTLDDSHYTRYLVPLLESVAQRLGLGGIQSLFRAYAAQIAVQVQNGPSDFLHLPPRVLGYRTHKECSESTFTTVLPITVVTSSVNRDEKGQRSYESVLRNSFFDRYCKTVRQQPVRALKACFSQLVAAFIIFSQEEPLLAKRGESSPLREWIMQCARDCDNSIDPEEYVRRRADRIVAEILCYGGDTDYLSTGSIVGALRRSDGSAALVFNHLNKFRRFDDFPMHMVNFPAAPTDTVLSSLKWFTDTFVDKLEHGLGMATIYHATHHLFASVLSTPLVNEQLRYIHALSLWLAISAAILDQPAMTRMLLTHSLAILPEEDLTHSAQSIISWTLGQIHPPDNDDDEESQSSKDAKSLNIELGIIINRIAELGVQFSQSTDPRTSDMGRELMEWVETELQTLCEMPKIREALQPTITLWPRDLSVQSQGSPESRELADSQTAKVLSTGQQRLLGRFRAARHLNSIPLYATSTFATDHFWTLKTAIPDDPLLLQKDVDAFVELLSKSSGQFQSVRNELPDEDRLTDRQRRDVDKPIKFIIVRWLLDMTAVVTAQSLHIIHETLRLLCHPQCGEALIEEDPILNLFRVGSLDPIAAVSCEPSDLKRSGFRNLASDYSRWISDVTVFFSRLLAKVDIFYGQLPPLLVANTTFSANLLPILVHQLLIYDRTKPFSGSIRPIVSNYIRSVIHSDLSESTVREAAVNIVIHLRHFSPPEDGDPLGYDKWLDLDLLDVCRTSLSCGAYTTALLFLELAAEYQPLSAKGLETAYDSREAEREGILYEIYRHIDEPDGFYAIKGRDIRKHLMHKFHHEKKWTKAFQAHVSQYEGALNEGDASGGGRQELPGVIQSLHSFGFNQLGMSLARGTEVESSTDLVYSLAWRTEAWDLPQATSPSTPSSFLYGVMRAVHRGRNTSITQKLCDNAIRWEMQQLRVSNVENVVEIRRAIQSLLCLREIKQWLNQRHLFNSQSSSYSEPFLALSELSSEFEFEAAEAIVATRISLAHSLKQSIKSSQIGDMESASISSLTDLETRCLVNLAANARISNMPQVAYNAVSRAQQLTTKPGFHVSKEFAEALWVQQEHAMAIQFLTELISQRRSLDQNGATSERLHVDNKLQEVQGWALLHARLGSWTSAACSANPSDIRMRYFDPAVKLLDPLDQIRRRAAKMVYYQYADFANKQLRQMEASEDYKLQKDWVARIQAEIRDLDSSVKGARSIDKEDIRKRRERAEKLLETDTKNIEEHEFATKSFLQQAISMYAHYMEASDEQDEEIAVRFCGLWFAKFESEIAAESIKHALQKISTHKLLFLSHQLTARLGTGSTSDGGKRNQRFLYQLVEGMCMQHPYHCLLQILTAKGQVQTPKKGRSHESPNDLHTKRQEEAKRIVEHVRNSQRPGVSGKYYRPQNFLVLMEETFQSYIEFAAYPIKDMGCKSGFWYPIPRSLGLYKWTWSSKSKAPPPQLSIPVATVDLPIEMGGMYSDIPTIHHYENVFTVAGGIHIPKIPVCVDSDGKQHKQLFKGEGDDDLRQDAVMQQIFQLVNILLSQDRESKRRKLSLRTYKVIPLPRQTGILQFVNNTDTISSWLTKAHARYNPKDIPLREATAKLKDQAKNASQEEKLKLFLWIRERFHPVMRHYFTESNKQPVVWYAKRLTYARSAATCSIVGHILGLGDRHISNLMMDARTGEMLHIDFGIAFDQGKLLAVPELVPFRLTADVVDGMGIAGTEGVFRRCSEETLRVLREGATIIRTVLEVLKYDPLHSWAATAAKLRRVQDVDDAVSDDDGPLGKGTTGSEPIVQGAERAINSVARKLDASLSVEYTVNELIVAARDPANLARIFYGWSPHC